jgi:nucleoside-diphosphate-sugar epimerase
MAAAAIAITGASGWLGRALARTAVAAGVEVRGVVRSEESARRVEAEGGRAVQADGLDPAGLGDAIVGCTALVHLIGIGAERGGATYEDVNVGGMRRAIEAARRSGVPRIVYLSGLGVARYGLSRRSTNAYFLSKLATEVELFRSGLEAVVFRPSYVVGPEDELIPALLHDFTEGSVEIVGNGRYRVQPIALRDACESMLAGSRVALPGPSVFDLVGPEPLAYRDFVARVAAAAARADRASSYTLHEAPVEEADRRAAAGGYRGLLPDELDVLLCDESADPEPLVRLLGRPLSALDEALEQAVRGSQPRSNDSFRRT